MKKRTYNKPIKKRFIRELNRECSTKDCPTKELNKPYNCKNCPLVKKSLNKFKVNVIKDLPPY